MVEGAASAAPPAVFASVHFQVVLSEELPRTLADELRASLFAYGATEHTAPETAATDELAGLTHIVTASVDFDGYDAADARMIAIVHPQWVAASVKKLRLANPRSHSPDPRMFFSGLVFCTAELPAGDKDAIIGGILAMGGLYSGSISKLVTHVIARDMEPAVCQTVLAKGFACKLVVPQWFDDCLRLGKRIDETPYLFPNPPTLDNDAAGGKITHPDLQGQLSAKIDDAEVPSSEQATRDAVFADKNFVLAGDLALSDHLRESIIKVIRAAGGRVCDVVDDCHVFVGYYRHGYGYEQAYKAGKTIGNLTWLYWMLAHNRWTSPLKRLLHYPIARDGLPGTQSFRLCLSNYSGEARIYLENLAKASGCEFTKTLKNDNTHLITAHTQSEKCEAAKEWGIYLLNHLWLEESYARWQIQDPTNSRYNHFPPRTNLTEVVGQTPNDEDALERQFRKLQTLEGSAHTGSPSTKPEDHKPFSPTKVLSQRTKHEQIERERKAETPAAAKSRRSGKENETPPTLTKSTRSAKDKAAARLHDLGSDMALFEKEMKRKGGVIYGGRRKLVDNNISARKRSMSDADASEGEVEGETPSKRTKPTSEPPKMRILVTGVPKYNGQDKPSTRLKDQLRALGILITQSDHNCKYLIAPRILRTRKFVCAVAQAPSLIDPSFLDACLDANEILDPERFPLADPAGEKHYGLHMDEVLRKARAHRGKMLKGWTVWATKDIHGGFDSYNSIVEANGGKCLLFQGRPGSIPQAATGSDSEDASRPEPQPAYLISGRSSTEQHLWVRFQQLAQEAGRLPRIVQSDWMLDAALKQEPIWNVSYEQTVGDFDSGSE